MLRRCTSLISFLIAASLLLGLAIPARSDQPRLKEIKLPAGFEISLYANAPGARSMTLGPDGTVYVGTLRTGKVYAIPKQDASNGARKIITIATGLNMPNGVAFRDGALYVAENNRVLRYDGIQSQLEHAPKPVVINDSFPKDRAHGWKFIAFGPDGLLYVPVGAPCNICEPDPDRYALISRMKADGSGREVFARGIRNTVGFDWHPQTKEMWFTDNGRDNMGEDVPPDELNRASKPGLNFGYPYCHGGDIADDQFGKKHPCSDFLAPVQKLGAHVAALGMRFYTGSMFPSEYRDQIFIAEHGSWNRSSPVGYRVTIVRLENNRAVSYRPFAEGWLQAGHAWGRPVDILMMPDGALLVSDDDAGAIYRISHK
jgi:glucose/arabinose dehydrogenase